MQPPLVTIFSLEDQPTTIAGSLDSLEFDGHRIAQRNDLAAARLYLGAHDVDLVLLDERVAGSDNGGSTLIGELKRGALGSRNVGAPFAFVTGNIEWVDQRAMSRLPGFLGVTVKGGDLTRDLRQWIDELVERRQPAGAVSPPAERLPGAESLSRRIPLKVADVQRRGTQQCVLLTAPSWSPHEQIAYPVASLPEAMRAEPESLRDGWFMARVNLHEPDPAKIVISDWEVQDPLDDDDLA
jgi:hypothetical protein